MKRLPVLGGRPHHDVVRRSVLIGHGPLSLSACNTDSTTQPTTATPRDSVAGTATTAVLLSTGSTDKDEDPSVLKAADGKLFVAWFSDRGGSSAVYVSSTTDKVTWSASKRISNNTFGNFYPNLIQDIHIG